MRIKKAHRQASARKNFRIGSTLNTRDFSAIEDSAQWRMLISSVVIRAGQNAAAEARVAGLPSIFVENNKIIREDVSGKRTELSSELPHSKEFFVHYSPSLKLHVKPR